MAGDQAVASALKAIEEAHAFTKLPDARRIMVAIGLQESQLVHRYQVLDNGRKGPARGWPQFEQGGIKGVMRHKASKNLAGLICRAHGVDFDAKAIWSAMEHDDILAAVFARLLLWTDPYPLPTDEDGAWALYAERTWKPGKPHRDRWTGNWHKAAELLS